MRHVANFFLSLDTDQHVYILYPTRPEDLSTTNKISPRALAARSAGDTEAREVSSSVFERHPWLLRPEVGFSLLALDTCFNTDKHLA